MKKELDAIKLKRQLQKEAEKRLSGLSTKEQISMLEKKYGHLMRKKQKVHSA
jgi:hypothetical protein